MDSDGAGPRRIVGINRTQDASLCLLEDGAVRCLIQKERLTRRKHDWGRLGDMALYTRHIAALSHPVDLVVECYSSDKEAANIAAYHDELRTLLRFRGEPRIVTISHHLAHLHSAFDPSGASSAAAMIIDFQGSRVADLSEPWSGSDRAPSEHLEAASFYRCQADSIDCLAKQTWAGAKETPTGLGAFYLYLTRAIFGPGAGQEGKVTGLAPYGNSAQRSRLPPLEVCGYDVSIPPAWQDLFSRPDRPYLLVRGDGDGDGNSERFQRAADLAAAGQRAFEDALLALAVRLRADTGETTLCFAGGCALNCSANGRLRHEGPFSRLFVPPCPGDGGTALGCALWGERSLRGRSRFSWTTSDYLGPLPPPLDEASVADALARMAAAAAAATPAPAGAWAVSAATLQDTVEVQQPADLAGAVAAFLAEGRAVAVWNQRSESGPRALGHRSILADPRRDDMRRWINRDVKGREAFRPLAPMVLAEDAAALFANDGPLPFMQVAVQVRPEVRRAIPAVTHVDGSARIQTVGPDDDRFMRATLQAFQALTGLPVLLNTSFNTREEPIVESFADALATFARIPLQALVAPPFFLRKRPQPPTLPEPLSAPAPRPATEGK